MSFDGRSSWPISTQHMNLGPVSTDSGICVGGILNKERKYAADDIWYVGAPFLRSVYTLFRFQPLSIGFANLSIDVGGTSGECYSLTVLFYWERVLPGGAPRTGNGSGYTGEQPVLLNDSTTYWQTGLSFYSRSPVPDSNSYASGDLCLSICLFSSVRQ